MGSKVTLVAKMAQDILDEGPYIGIDKGALMLALAQKQMLCAIGDFDSVNIKELNEIKQYCDDFVLLDRKKDDTDSESAIAYAISKGFEEIVLIGGTNGRLDHFLANIMLVYRSNANLVLKDEKNRVKKLNEGIHFVKKSRYSYLSFIAFEEACVSLEGVAYPLEHATIKLGDIFTISNEIIGELATISVYSGKVLLIESTD